MRTSEILVNYAWISGIFHSESVPLEICFSNVEGGTPV